MPILRTKSKASRRGAQNPLFLSEWLRRRIGQVVEVGIEGSLMAEDEPAQGAKARRPDGSLLADPHARSILRRCLSTRVRRAPFHRFERRVNRPGYDAQD